MIISVFITGATGFIAQHIIKLLISKGYRVVGTVRSFEKGLHLESLFGSQNFTFEVVPDIVAPGAFNDVLQKHPEITVFMHTASPVRFSVKDVEIELLKPAVEGTKNALNAIKLYGSQIRHVVVTSSISAMLDAVRVRDPSYIVCEKSWSPITWDEAKSKVNLGYMGSKKFAEKAAWESLIDQKPTFSLNTVNAVYVFGPQAFDSEVKPTLNLSCEIVNRLLKLSPKSQMPSTSGHFVDVRDVARAHLAAFEQNLNNQRLLMHSQQFISQDILQILHERFECLRNKLPAVSTGKSNDRKYTVHGINDTATRELLGFQYIPLEESIADLVTQILKAQASETHSPE